MMVITKGSNGYILNVQDDSVVFFDRFTRDDICVNLWRGGHIVSMQYFEQATEFYRAWRAMK